MIAAEIVASALDVTDPVTRLGRMVGAEKVHPGYVQYLHFGTIVTSTSSAKFAGLLRQLAPRGSTKERLKLAVDLIGYRWPDTQEIAKKEDPETIAEVKDVLAESSTTDDRADFWWAHAMNELVALDPQWTADVATRAISGDDFSKRDKASGILAGMAKSSPIFVMEAVGNALLDSKTGWRWRIGSNRELFSALPVNEVMNWLSRIGVEGARRIARHLPSPSISEGQAIVPELTQRVLEAYGDDESVFNEFAAGRHDMEVSWGSVSSNYEGHARLAEAFLNHPLPAIREWATREIASAEQFARYWRKYEEDEGWSETR